MKLVCSCRTIEKLDVKDDRVRALEEQRRDIQQKIEAQRREFVERHDLLKADHEMLLNAVSHRITYLLWFTMIYITTRHV